MTWLKSLLFICVLVFVFLFAALAVNQQQVALSFVQWETPFTLSIFWWLFLALTLGVFLGWFYSFVRHLPLRMQVRKLKKALAAAEPDQQKAQGPTDSSTAPFSERLPQ